MLAHSPSARSPIGVFDSGVGGLSILRAMRAAMPHEHFIYFADTGHAPYGERDESFVAARSLAVAKELIDGRGIKALVVACNTATAAAIHLLRERHLDLPLVGVEPALKPAALRSRTKRIAVLATRRTLASAKFAALHGSLKDQAEFVLQPCDGLAAAIEAGDSDRIGALCSQYVAAAGPFGSDPGRADTLVLGCTHYPFASAQIASSAGPGVMLVETGEPVAAQALRRLQSRNLLHESGTRGSVEYQTTGSLSALHDAAARWLGEAGSAGFPPSRE